MPPLITRFAPSPTGYLHLGHVASMAFVFGMASLAGAKVLLRMEDHDGERSRPEYEQAILDDMAWLGFFPHNWQQFSLLKSANDYRQSACTAFYTQSLKILEDRQQIYSCICSRKQLTEPLLIDGVEPRYSGTCRGRGLTLASNNIRYRLTENSEDFYDQLLGQMTQCPFQQCGDFLLKDRRGYFSYHLAVVVDDIRHKINWIIRGEDILPCTGRQLALAKSLGRHENPVYFHHPLIFDAAGKKLSKRTFAEGMIHRRERGESAEDVLGEALYLVDILPKKLRVKAMQVPDILKDAGFADKLVFK